jgi:hypothetical protein
MSRTRISSPASTACWIGGAGEGEIRVGTVVAWVAAFSRIGMWRGAFGLSLPVSAPFVSRRFPSGARASSRPNADGVVKIVVSGLDPWFNGFLYYMKHGGQMRFLLFLCTITILTSCAEMSKSLVSADGRYHFQNDPISVWAPDACLLDMFVDVSKSKRAVDFVTGRGYWTEGGQYAVIVYDIPSEITGAKSYEETTAKYFKSYMVKDRASMGFNLKITDEKQITVNGNPAYQAIAVDPGKAIFVATSELHKSRITIASLVYPDKNGTAEKQIPWRCYDKFVNSISEQ